MTFSLLLTRATCDVGFWNDTGLSFNYSEVDYYVGIKMISGFTDNTHRSGSNVSGFVNVTVGGESRTTTIIRDEKSMFWNEFLQFQICKSNETSTEVKFSFEDAEVNNDADTPVTLLQCSYTLKHLRHGNAEKVAIDGGQRRKLLQSGAGGKGGGGKGGGGKGGGGKGGGGKGGGDGGGGGRDRAGKGGCSDDFEYTGGGCHQRGMFVCEDGDRDFIYFQAYIYPTWDCNSTDFTFWVEEELEKDEEKEEDLENWWHEIVSWLGDKELDSDDAESSGIGYQMLGLSTLGFIGIGVFSVCLAGCFYRRTSINASCNQMCNRTRSQSLSSHGAEDATYAVCVQESELPSVTGTVVATPLRDEMTLKTI